MTKVSVLPEWRQGFSSRHRFGGKHLGIGLVRGTRRRLRGWIRRRAGGMVGAPDCALVRSISTLLKGRSGR